MTSQPNRTAVLTSVAAIAAALVVAGGAWLLFRDFRSASELGRSTVEITADEFGHRVRQYLLDNPEVIVEAMQGFERRQQEAVQGAAQRVLAERAGEILRDAASPVGGNSEGDVTLVEFFDYNCPYCRRVAPAMTEAMAADPQLRIVYKEFPILGPNSASAAKVALAAYRQDKAKYVELHKALMKHNGPTNEESALATAADLGFDIEKLKADMNASEITSSIDRNYKLAQALGIDGTPAFVIGNQIIPGAVNLKTLQEAIEQARASQQAKQPQQ